MSLASRARFRRALFWLGLRAFEHGWLRGAFGVCWMHVLCDSGRRSRPAVAREVAPPEAAAVLDRWVANHRRYARFVAKRLGWHGDGSAAAWLASRLPVVAITAD